MTKICNCALPAVTGSTKCCENCSNNSYELTSATTVSSQPKGEWIDIKYTGAKMKKTTPYDLAYSKGYSDAEKKYKEEIEKLKAEKKWLEEKVNLIFEKKGN